MLRRFLLVWLLGLSLFAVFWPLNEFDPFTASKPLLSYIIAVTMFCIGCLLPPAEVREMGRRWHTVVSGTCVQYLSMPFLAWSLGRLLRLPHDLNVGLLLAGCVPGAMASNVLTMLARGNVSYSVGLTTSATLISPVVVPLAMWLTLGATVAPSVFLDAGRDLFLLVVAPVVAGFCLAQSFARIRVFQSFAEGVANLSILWIIATVVGINRGRLEAVTLQVFIALLLLNMLGYAAGWWGGVVLKLPDSMRRALTLEVGMQNAGLGAALATTLFPDLPSAALPPALYAFGCMLTGTMLAQWMGRRASDDSVAATTTSAESGLQ